MGGFVNETTAEIHENRYRLGGGHDYPNENVVRIVRWFLQDLKPATEHLAGKPEDRRGANKIIRILDYGFGPGENLLFLLREGYSVSGIEVSPSALKITEKKLERYPEFSGKFELALLDGSSKSLPYEDNYFDVILANQVLYFIGDKEKIEEMLIEFDRILRPGGKLIASMLSRINEFSVKGQEIIPDVYEYYISGLETENKLQVYIIRDESHARELFSMFDINEVGYFDNYYCGVCGHHFVVLAEPMKSQK